MNLSFLAFDSMGVRSMCTFLEDEKRILIDPGVSLAPFRFGLPPHSLELQQLMKKRQLIQEYAQKTDIITISHWHNDHHTPFMYGLYNSVTPDLAASVYKGKIVLGKGLKGLNFMQKKRAQSFLRHQPVEFCDGRTFTYGGLTLTFSSPVHHGTSTKVPVIPVSVEGTKKVVHASDVQGFSGLQFIKKEQPDILIMSGPPVSLLSEKDIMRAESNISEMLDYCHQLILDHHLLREKHYKELLPSIWKSPKVKTAAEFEGKPNTLLEADRETLFKELP
ncbi:MAG: hypothetical protein HXS44_17695 [Theionarchaea archaeon]|nr:hypothetical protein [Theionarchaea archaeon]